MQTSLARKPRRSRPAAEAIAASRRSTTWSLARASSTAVASLVIVNRFRGRPRLFDFLLAPLYRLLSYRVDLEGEALVAAAGLTLVRKRAVNLLGYSIVLVCRA